MHLGPNAWAGLFVAKLANTTHDAAALQLALDIEYWIANDLPHSVGGVAMGLRDDPYGANWSHIYSTENNLSYYAFLTELLRSALLDRAQRAAIILERDRVENWVLKIAYDPESNLLIRGTNLQGKDPVLALDTATWLISTIGPRHMAAHGIDPFTFMQKAQETFEVTIAGHVGVDAADRAEADRVYNTLLPHVEEINRPAGNHHRVIWYEGMGQYILAWSTLAEYADHMGDKNQAVACMKKVNALTREFDAAALKRFSGNSSYPYATPGKFFQYGWGAPKEAEGGPASSLASGIWRCFAGLGYDPLAGRELGLVQHVHVAIPERIQLAKREPVVLYGTSEDMTTEAWKALNAGDYELAARQAEATIQEWSSAALYLQTMKKREVGSLVEYGGTAEDKRKIFKYWALNDVAAAYFILGQALDQKSEYEKASHAFQQIVDRYSLAQIWDPRGWFWSPVDAVTNDYVLRDRKHYGWIIPQEFAGGSRVGKRPF